ncbi:hypothetical protein TNCV_913541 [Trichonephila clavipes]|nr:hypothetical protein TNCV_913541 [Trichonephila clavipes]
MDPKPDFARYPFILRYATANEIADRLAKEGSENETSIGTSLTYQEMYSKARCKLNLMRRTPPAHQWHTGTSFGSMLEIKCDSGSKTILCRLTSGHL